MDAHGVKDLETVTDPETGRGIKDVLVGNRFFMKLSHQAEDKLQGRGFGGYTQNEVPAKGGPEGSKQVGLLLNNSLLSHGAYNVIGDIGTVRGQRNEDYWTAFMQGRTPPAPKVPFVYRKFVNQLRGAGINVVDDGPKTHIMAMTDKDIDRMAGDRVVTSGETVEFSKGMKPIEGGLFDLKTTGGIGGDRWAAIPLHEPMINPVMEDPVRRLLGLTKNAFEDVLAGREKLTEGGTGPSGIQQALAKINLDKAITQARQDIASGRKTKRDVAVRKLAYLKAAKKLGIHPADWVLTKVPVLPPMYRPVSALAGSNMPLVADANYLYRELIEANNNLKTMGDLVDDVGDERLALYHAFKAVTGLGDPVHPKLQEKRVKGLLKHVFGSSPKHGLVQRRLIGSAVDLVGRAVIAPNPDLDMDQVGIPEDRAWHVYRPFVARRLRRRGMRLTDALRQISDRTPLAREELLQEMSHRPVMIDRAPAWHKFGILGAWPKLVKGNTMQISPLVVKGFAADFDGDAMNFNVPGTEEARQEVIDKMMPSRNLISPADFKTPIHQPSQEFTAGLFVASTGRKDRPKRTFADLKSAIAAYEQGRIDIDDPIVILQ